MNTESYIVRGMEVLMYSLKGGTARKLECRMCFFNFTEGRIDKFPTGNNGLQTL